MDNDGAAANEEFSIAHNKGGNQDEGFSISHNVPQGRKFLELPLVEDEDEQEDADDIEFAALAD